MMIVGMKSDYILCANQVYSNIKQAELLFEQEAYVLSYAKCALLRNEELDDFNIKGINVSVYNTGNGYELCFNGHTIEIEVYDKLVIDFCLIK